MSARAGGLYGGIQFSTAKALPEGSKPATQHAPSAQAPSSAVIEAAPILSSVAATTQSSVEPVQAQAVPETSTSSKSSAAWSAALAFAPVRRSNKSKPATSRLPPGAAIVASLAAAAGSALSVLETATSLQPKDEPETTGWAKKVQAPSMVIDDDVNGFRAVKPGEGKRRKKKNINANQLVWDPREPYDPFHPNDYHEYKKWKKSERERQRREEIRRIEDLKRRRDSSHSEYSSDSEADDDRRNRKTARYHSPERDDDKPRGLGMRPAEEPDTPMANEAPTFVQSSASTVPMASTGEEAYLRRLAMSQKPSRPVAPSFQAAPAFIPQEPPSLSHSPPFEAQQPPKSFQAPQFTPALVPDPPQMAPEDQAPTQPSLTQAMIDEKLKKAAAIAAKLSALNKPPPPAAMDAEGSSQGPARHDPATFGARMMAKYGHVPGQGLGANADGIVQPIALERAAIPKGGKKGDQGGDGKAKKPSAGGMGMGGAKMGRIVNAQAEEKNKAELAKYGESSRVVVLRNMVSPQDVDEDLQGEIGDECSKHGTVERVLVHMPSMPPLDPIDAVRIFVVFSGVAGAWKAIRDLDGRFFGGRTVTAKYFDEGNFSKRLFDLPL